MNLILGSILNSFVFQFQMLEIDQLSIYGDKSIVMNEAKLLSSDI